MFGVGKAQCVHIRDALQQTAQVTPGAVATLNLVKMTGYSARCGLLWAFSLLKLDPVDRSQSTFVIWLLAGHGGRSSGSLRAGAKPDTLGKCVHGTPPQRPK